LLRDLAKLLRRVVKRRESGAAQLSPRSEQFLSETYRHYQRLPLTLQGSFSRAAHAFLSDRPITGIGTDVTDELRVLVAASAVTLSFRWSGYKWRQLPEVLLYPDNFDREYQFGGAERAGTVDNWGTVVLSVPALVHSFQHPDDCYHVGLHEFAHVLDLGRSRPNGIPPGLSMAQMRRWVEIQRTEMEELRMGRSILEPYGMSNDVEFFAVSVEAFFQTPIEMRVRHQSLYSFLSEYFDQDPAWWESLRQANAGPEQL
jgi:MtfA peptidase